MNSSTKIFVIDDERIIRVTIADDLRDEGFKVAEFANSKTALRQLTEQCPDIVISDIKMPGMSGIELLQKAIKLCPDTIFIMMTAYGKIEDAVKVMKLGAFDYLTKPFSHEELLLKLSRIKQFNAIKEENKSLKTKLFSAYDFSNYVGSRESFDKISKQVKLVAQSQSTVLLIGETGTGKELVTNIIHYNSLRKNKPFIKVSCAILARDIFESELFGHEKGAFTGAENQKMGRFERANGGTLYLDDIEDMPLDLQVKLLRVLEEKEIERLGSTQTIKIDVRIIASTKANLRKLVDEGKFREDLFYRLNVFPIHLLPLRQRKDDIAILAVHFMKKFSSNPNINISDDVLKVLENFHFPGNVRELRNIMERLVLLSGNKEIRMEHMPYEIINVGPVQICPKLGKKALSELVNDFESQMIKTALHIENNNKTKAARLLGIPSSTLRSKIEKLGL